MPRGRIRTTRPGTVTGSSSSTGDGNPIGSSLTTEGFGIEILAAPEVNPAPADAATFALAVLAADSVAAPAEASSLDIATALADSITTPTEGRSAVSSVGATTATASAPVGAGWTNPANAQGPADAASASMTSAAGLNPAQQSGVLTLAFASVGTPAGAAPGSVTIASAMTVAALTGTGSMVIATSTDGGANYTQRFSSTATYTGPLVLTAASIGLTLANLAQFRVRFTTSVLGSTLAASSATVESAVLTVTF